MLTLTPTVKFACDWTVGGSWRAQKEPTPVQGENANSTHKGLSPDSDWEPSCCEVTELTSMQPLKHSFAHL